MPNPQILTLRERTHVKGKREKGSRWMGTAGVGIHSPNTASPRGRGLSYGLFLSQRMGKPLERPRHRGRGEVRHTIRFVFLKVAWGKSFKNRMRKGKIQGSSGWRQGGQRPTDDQPSNQSPTDAQ